MCKFNPTFWNSYVPNGTLYFQSQRIPHVEIVQRIVEWICHT
jgi:hypothetical protein